MRYDYQLKILELKGIVFYRNFANFVLSKICKEDQHSFLIDGDKNFLLSYLLSKELKMIHVQDFGFEHPYLPCIIDVSDERFKLEDYDVVICFFSKNTFIKKVFDSKVKAIIFIQLGISLDDINGYCKIPGDFKSTLVDGYTVLYNM